MFWVLVVDMHPEAWDTSYLCAKAGLRQPPSSLAPRDAIQIEVKVGLHKMHSTKKLNIGP